MNYLEMFKNAQSQINNLRTNADNSNLQYAVNSADERVRDWFGVSSHPIHLWENYIIGDADESEFMNDFTGTVDDIDEAFELMDSKLADFFENEWQKQLEKA